MATSTISDTDLASTTKPDSTTAMPSETVTTKSIEALQSADQRRLMDIVDRLRRSGLSGIVSLPQLVVCGDQSSGKSSVLEAITEIPFPRKENLCTRFATEIVLRRHVASSILITITPDKNRSDQECKQLKRFNETITDFSQLPGIIDDATQAMGLGRVGESKAFSRDVLSIEICGPDRPQLTLVDLPGLIHATNKAQTEADKSLILDLVKDYMRNPRTIILAVVSAKNDFANQIILDHCKTLDPKSERTLGIVTKPDYLREGSQNEADWIELAQNKNIYFKLGWHMLKNRADNEMEFTFAERNESEGLFFLKGRYNELPRNSVGIDSLRARLSQLLLGHLKKELPTLREEMITKLQMTSNEIERLGEKRATTNEQRMMLIRMSMQVNDILKSAIKGFYESSFFGSIDMESAIDSTKNIRRLRAVIQYLNLDFADNMRLRGHKFAVEPGPGDDEDSEDELAEDDPASFLPRPQALSRASAIDWVQNVLERSRGSELPGNFNPMLISHLFWEQSSPWETIASEHIANVARVCKEFVYAAIKHTAGLDFVEKLLPMSVDPALSKALQDCKEELRKVIADKGRHPMTYNHYFTTTIQKQRQRKYQEITLQANVAASKQSQVHGVPLPYLNAATMEDALDDSLEQNMDKFSAAEALDNQRAYYKDELKYFINAITKQVIERHLVNPLPEIILSPVVVAGFTEKEIEFVAAEPPELTQQRLFLENRKEMLENGMDTFREFMGGLKR